MHYAKQKLGPEKNICLELHAQKLRNKGRQVGFVFFLIFIIIFTRQRPYGTLKHNLVKFKYTQAAK